MRSTGRDRSLPRGRLLAEVLITAPSPADLVASLVASTITQEPAEAGDLYAAIHVIPRLTDVLLPN